MFKYQAQIESKLSPRFNTLEKAQAWQKEKVEEWKKAHAKKEPYTEICVYGKVLKLAQLYPNMDFYTLDWLTIGEFLNARACCTIDGKHFCLDIED